jgi:FkbM family methyltransferase
VNVWGASIRPPSLDRALAAWLSHIGAMNGAERRFFEKILKAGQTVIDVGANQGIFTLLFSRLVGPAGRVIALEPAPSLFAALDANCQANGADNVTRLAVAAGGVRSQGVLHCSRFNSGDNRMSGSAGGRSVAVDVVPIDELMPTGEVDLVKIDVQGFELKVVQGMAALLDRSHGVTACFEYSPSGLGRADSDPRELLDFFLQRGFSLFELSDGGPAAVSRGELIGSTPTSDWSWRNIVAARG